MYFISITAISITIRENKADTVSKMSLLKDILKTVQELTAV